MSRKAIRILNGSRLYGTHSLESDHDYINIYVPNFRDVILGNINSLGSSTDSKDDDKHMSIYKFLRLLEQGQTLAVESLFCPLEYVEFDTEDDKNRWATLRGHRHNLIGKSMKSMLGYCKAQAYKYCKKSKNLEVYLGALDILDTQLKSFEKLSATGNDQNKTTDKKSYSIAWVFDKLASLDGVTVSTNGKFRYINILGAEFIETYDMVAFKKHVEDKVSNCSQRTLSAYECDGKDWKALSHALRVGLQIKELYETNNLVFPLKDVEYLKAIKFGQIPYDEVVDDIERITDEVAALDFSKFSYDNKFVNDWLYGYITSQNMCEV